MTYVARIAMSESNGGCSRHKPGAPATGREVQALSRRWCSGFVPAVLLALILTPSLQANPPVASYLFPAGGQRGQTVTVHVGGLFLPPAAHPSCGWEVLGAGITTDKTLRPSAVRWFEGPMLPLPESQRTEDYPREMVGAVRIGAEAPLGSRRVHVWTSEGVASSPAFVVGDLPEVVEEEKDGDPLPTPVTLPVTVNGRIFPHDNVDDWSFTLSKGQTVRAEVTAARIGSPLDSRLELIGPDGRVLADNDDHFGSDSLLVFCASADGKYRIRMQDANHHGGQNYVYRLTLTHGPSVEHVFPLGGRRGERVAFALSGVGMPSEPVTVAMPMGKDHAATVRFPITAGKFTSPISLDVDELPEFRPEDAKGTKVIPTPAILNGRIEAPGAIQEWKVSAAKGRALRLELRARELGSPLQGVVEVADAAGKVLGKGEAGKSDPVVTVQPATDGTLTVRVRERFRSRGGPDFAYRLRLTNSEPDFHLSLETDTLTLPRKTAAKLRVHLERAGGFNGPVTVAVEGLPDTVAVSPLKMNPGQGQAELTLQVGPMTTLGLHHVKVVGSATMGGGRVTRPAQVPTGPGGPGTDTVVMSVALTAPFKVVGSYDLRLAPRGTVFVKHYKIERGGYTGPLEVRLADRQARHLQGVTGPVLTIPGDATEFDYPVTLPPWMETGRTSRACVMATGFVEEAGVRHPVSYTSVEQKDQIIAVVETGRLGFELGKSSVTCVPDGTVEVPIEVRRAKEVSGAVRVELLLPAHIQGTSAEPVTIPADRVSGVMKVRFAAGAGPFNMPLTVRAAVTAASGPVTAEAKLEVVSP
jgi:hypothetical protein